MLLNSNLIATIVDFLSIQFDLLALNT